MTELRYDSDCFDAQSTWGELRAAAVRLAALWCDSREEAGDLAHDALVHLLSRKATVRSPVPWLFVVTGRLASRGRHRQRSERELLRSLRYNPEPSLKPLIPHAIARDNRLSAAERRLLVWVLFGYSHAEIAVRLGCGRSSIGQRVSRAMAKLLAPPLAEWSPRANGSSRVSKRATRVTSPRDCIGGFVKEEVP